jgi:hypothetical protein
MPASCPVKESPFYLGFSFFIFLNFKEVRDMQINVNRDMMFTILEEYFVRKDYEMIDLIYIFLDIMDRSGNSFIKLSIPKEMVEQIRLRIN